MKITVSGDGLDAHFPDDETQHLVPETATRFFVMGNDAIVDFQMGADPKKAKTATLYQDGGSAQAKLTVD